MLAWCKLWLQITIITHIDFHCIIECRPKGRKHQALFLTNFTGSLFNSVYRSKPFPYAQLPRWGGPDPPDVFLYSVFLFTRKSLLAIFHSRPYGCPTYALCCGLRQ